MKSVDLRSDTVTRPTKGMLEAMFSAEVGDDVFQADPSVNALEAHAAELAGMERRHWFQARTWEGLEVMG